MPALKPTDYVAKIVWLGRVSSADTSLRASAIDALQLDFEGIVGDLRHRGRTRPSCSRVTSQHAKGTEIGNERQLSVLSAEELSDIAVRCGLDDLDPSLLGASVVLEGIPDLSHLPPSSRLQAPDGTTIVVDMENRPCVLPAKEIEIDAPGHGKAFKAAAAGRRGVTAWVQRPGTLRLGDALRLHIPDQPAWAP